ncbi:hypothetical protein [Aliikangiella sp. IMCC44359]
MSPNTELLKSSIEKMAKPMGFSLSTCFPIMKSRLKKNKKRGFHFNP